MRRLGELQRSKRECLTSQRAATRAATRVAGAHLMLVETGRSRVTGERGRASTRVVGKSERGVVDISDVSKRPACTLHYICLDVVLVILNDTGKLSMTPDSFTTVPDVAKPH